jgi:flagellar hook-associated protein 3 FlgL
MNYISVGDMAQFHQMRRHNVQLKTLSSQLTRELTTGRKADTGAAVRGDFTALAGIERSLASLASYRLANSEAAQLAGTMQGALEVIQTMMSDIGPLLLSSSTSSSATMVSATTSDARQKLEAAIAALNTNTAGRYSFSGAATDTRPLASTDEILTALSGVIAGETGTTAIVAAVSNWFDAPQGGGGYLDIAWRGGAPATAIQIGTEETAALGLTAADGEIRNALKGLALASLVSIGALATDTEERARLTRAAGEMVMGANDGLVLLRARVGAVEGQIASGQARNSAETATLLIAKSGLTAADPYETATALEAVQTQLETLYTLTARLARLSLTDYLK